MLLGVQLQQHQACFTLNPLSLAVSLPSSARTQTFPGASQLSLCTWGGWLPRGAETLGGRCWGKRPNQNKSQLKTVFFGNWLRRSWQGKMTWVVLLVPVLPAQGQGEMLLEQGWQSHGACH